MRGKGTADHIFTRRCEGLIQAISHVLLRYARLVQVNRALSLIVQLTNRMREFVSSEVELLLDEGDTGEPFAPSKNMIEEALKQKKDNPKTAHSFLRDMEKQIRELIKTNSNVLQGSVIIPFFIDNQVCPRPNNTKLSL